MNKTARAVGDRQRRPVIFLPSHAVHALYIGMGESFALHRHYATQVSISLGAPLKTRTRATGPYSEPSSFIVSRNVAHQVDATGIPCFVPPPDNTGAILKGSVP